MTRKQTDTSTSSVVTTSDVVTHPLSPIARGVSTSELWMSVAGGYGVYEIAMTPGGPTMEQAICAVALAFAAVGYAIARGVTKSGAE